MTRNNQSPQPGLPNRRLNIDGMSTISSLLKDRRKTVGSDRIPPQRAANTSS